MPNRNYVKGRSHEYKALIALRKEGWMASRSAASHGAVDVFAAKDGKVLLVFDGDKLELLRAARNHPEIGAVRALGLHAYHVLDHETVVMSRAAAEQLGEVLSQ